MTDMTIEQIFEIQKKFSDRFFNNEEICSKEKEELTKTFCLSLHAEVSQLIKAVDYKQHLSLDQVPDRGRILFESVDCMRYILAILNLWNLSPDEFISAFHCKDTFLHKRNEVEDNTRSPGQKVIICDIDDVLSQFRIPYSEFVMREFGVEIDPCSSEYYNIDPISKAGIDPDMVFNKFVSDGSFANVPPHEGMIDFLRCLKDRGFWIHLLTARPGDDARCKYDTYEWLVKNNVPFDGIDFTPEKYIWLSDKDFYIEGDLVCAIDDSLKHASEYARHGVPVVVPEASYNEGISEDLRKNLKRVPHINVKMIEAIDNILYTKEGETQCP